jgi:hypothetical protein
MGAKERLRDGEFPRPRAPIDYFTVRRKKGRLFDKHRVVTERPQTYGAAVLWTHKAATPQLNPTIRRRVSDPLDAPFRLPRPPSDVPAIS